MNVVAPAGDNASRLLRAADAGVWLVAAAGVASFCAFGIVGIGKDASSWMTDYYWYVAGGRCFLLGSDMYALDCFSDQLARLTDMVSHAGLAYPPHFAALAMLFGALPLAPGKALLVTANLAAAGVLILAMARTISDSPSASAGSLPLNPAWSL